MDKSRFEMKIEIVDDGVSAQTHATMEGNIAPLMLVSVLSEVIPQALKEDKMMIFYLCSLLIQGKHSDKEEMELIKIDLPEIKKPEDSEGGE